MPKIEVRAAMRTMGYPDTTQVVMELGEFLIVEESGFRLMDQYVCGGYSYELIDYLEWVKVVCMINRINKENCHVSKS